MPSISIEKWIETKRKRRENKMYAKIPEELMHELYSFCNSQAKKYPNCDGCQHHDLAKKCLVLRILDIGYEE
jgi:hypothetical protein